ncbi:hypothetical protein AWC38_SpisGene3013 [Stylophora pistillata]|uniref:Uncharacterized protein n=1 Tax=Stylophora pistillata TaxID=50429 RepID=A0A2B4STI9_STYPI|nr:hypothetical protein AWC38_SpisGene3013 [Stylophora pistillata]
MDYHELILDWEKEREEKVDDEKATEEMRRKAMERLSVKKKRKVKEAESDKDEAGPSRRKSQRSLVKIMVQSVTNCREEKKQDMEIKENELKQQEQFHGLMLQQQQQMQQMHLQQQQQQQVMNLAMISTLSEMLNTSFIKPPSHGTTTTPLKHTSDSQKPTSKQDTEITPHHSATPSTKTLPNLANTSGHSRTTTLTILSHGASYHLTLPTTAPIKDATSA